jgi:hypothetical protein
MNRIVFQIESAAKHLERSRETLTIQKCALKRASTAFTAAEENLKQKITASEDAAKQFLRIFREYEIAYQKHKHALAECDQMTIERDHQILSVVNKSKLDSLAMLSDANKFLEMAEEQLVEERENYKVTLLELNVVEEACVKAEDDFQKTVETFWNSKGGVNLPSGGG